MQSPATPRILVCVSQLPSLAELRRLLAAGGYDVAGHLLGSPDPPDLPAHQLIAVEGQPGESAALELCRRFRARLDEGFVPILYITADHSPEARLAGLEAGADVCLLRPLAAGELLAQAQALLRIKELNDRLAQKTAEFYRLNRKLQQVNQQIDQELELAQRIQSSFLPQTLPAVPRTRFGVHYLLQGRVGGDFYDVFRLDEKHLGLYVADAMGHGVPASLLTIFVKKGVRAKEVFGQQYRLVPPGEVLTRLNRELIDQKLSENPFITMAYGLFNFQEGTICFARAGHPYPLYVPAAGDLQFWNQEGLLLGIVDATFGDRVYRLNPGDKVLLYTDGIDNASFAGQPPGADSLLACASKHRGLPAQEFVEQVARDLFGTALQPDDLTLLGLELLG
jgi:sigma-B regulation protein RsbU (phosphoserine phosphatase)